MAFTKINNSDLAGMGVIGLPDTPGLSTTAMQEKFEETARQVIIPKHNALIDELEDTTSAASLGAVAPTGRTGVTVQSVINSVSTGLDNLATAASTAIADAHTHSNKTELDGLSDNGAGNLLYYGNIIGITDYTNLSNLPQINGVTLTGNKSNAALGIPTQLSDLSDDSNHRVVTDTEKNTWNNKLADAYKQVDVTSGGTTTNVSASGGDTVKLKAGANVTLVANPSTKEITISSANAGVGDMLESDYDSSGDVKTAGGIDAYVQARIDEFGLYIEDGYICQTV